MSSFLRYVRPSFVLADLRDFFRQSRSHNLTCALLSAAATAVMALLFAAPLGPALKPKPPEILYFQLWSANRSVADVIAQQKRDRPIEEARKKALEEAREKRRQEFKRLEEKLKLLGF